jgi:hypothetical protein
MPHLPGCLGASSLFRPHSAAAAVTTLPGLAIPVRQYPEHGTGACAVSNSGRSGIRYITAGQPQPNAQPAALRQARPTAQNGSRP